MPRCDMCDNWKVIYSKIIKAPVGACMCETSSKNRNTCNFVPRRKKNDFTRST